MTVVGLTGGIGTGKSTVAGLLRELGAEVIDADQVSRNVVEPGSEGLQRIVDAFGSDVLTADGALDRAAMRRRIATDASARATLEGITHPLIGQAILGWLAERRQDGTRVAVV
ncbi:MAG: dephospho-CoA kinase, partial [Myxococcota bacterium]